MSRGRKTDFTKGRFLKLNKYEMNFYKNLSSATTYKDLETYYRDIKLALDIAYSKAKYNIEVLEG